jgi:anti-sigma regulatory factor (Ser/Thr protein kinase)
MANPDGSSLTRSPPRAYAELRVGQVMLPAAGQAAGLGRRFARETLALWGLGHLEENAVLLVSELVGNAIRHARTGGSALELRLEAGPAWLRIEVVDADPRPPQPRTPCGEDESGFGFVLVEALAGKWGVRETAAGKAVWAELGTDVAAEPDSA